MLGASHPAGLDVLRLKTGIALKLTGRSGYGGNAATQEGAPFAPQVF